jgi:hypothetical protein
LAFGVIATMLMVRGFPMFVIFFFGIFRVFFMEDFQCPFAQRNARDFRILLGGNDVLRDDERRWYGFEMQEVVNRASAFCAR